MRKKRKKTDEYRDNKLKNLINNEIKTKTATAAYNTLESLFYNGLMDEHGRSTRTGEQLVTAKQIRDVMAKAKQEPTPIRDTIYFNGNKLGEYNNWILNGNVYDYNPKGNTSRGRNKTK